MFVVPLKRCNTVCYVETADFYKRLDFYKITCSHKLIKYFNKAHTAYTVITSHYDFLHSYIIHTPKSIIYIAGPTLKTKQAAL